MPPRWVTVAASCPQSVILYLDTFALNFVPTQVLWHRYLTNTQNSSPVTSSETQHGTARRTVAYLFPTARLKAIHNNIADRWNPFYRIRALLLLRNAIVWVHIRKRLVLGDHLRPCIDSNTFKFTSAMARVLIPLTRTVYHKSFDIFGRLNEQSQGALFNLLIGQSL